MPVGLAGHPHEREVASLHRKRLGGSGPSEAANSRAEAFSIRRLEGSRRPRFVNFTEDSRRMGVGSHTFPTSPSELKSTSLHFLARGGKQQISASGTEPRWRADGREIYFVAQDGTLTAAEVAIKGNAIEVGAVRALGIPVVRGRGWLYDATPDGQRFLVAVPPQQKSAGLLTLVYNWPLLLKK